MPKSPTVVALLVSYPCLYVTVQLTNLGSSFQLVGVLRLRMRYYKHTHSGLFILVNISVITSLQSLLARYNLLTWFVRLELSNLQLCGQARTPFIQVGSENQIFISWFPREKAHDHQWMAYGCWYVPIYNNNNKAVQNITKYIASRILKYEVGMTMIMGISECGKG